MQNKQNPEFWMDRLNHLLKKSTVGGGQHRSSLLGAAGSQLTMDGTTMSGTLAGGGIGGGVGGGPGITDENLNLNQLQASKFRMGHDTTITGSSLGTGTTSQRRELLQQKLEQLKQHK